MSEDDVTPTDLGALVNAPEMPHRPTPPEGRRVPPNPKAPRPWLFRKQLERANQASAEGYDEREAASAETREIAEAIADGRVDAELVVSDSIVHEVGLRHLKGGE